jgi:SrtB family sortase
MAVAGGLMVLLAAVILVTIFVQRGRAKRLYSEADQKYVKPREVISLTLPGIGEGGDHRAPEPDAREEGILYGTEDPKEWYDDIDIDVAGLKAEYPEVVGWLYFEDGSISYPIMYSGDNEKYLKTDYTGSQSVAGAIFLDGESTPDISDIHSLIYGHNMRDLTMFGKLRYYRTDKDYLDSHRYFRVYTPDKIYRYEIFACGEVSAFSDIYYAFGPKLKDLPGLVDELNSLVPEGAELKASISDHIITLSTCTADESKRMIVSAVRIGESD